ncbi:MAG TPA: hypothetical protein VN726_04305 [Hanamia sp.]|nr:hypothetical protein [Hanamia sp.]
MKFSIDEFTKIHDVQRAFAKAYPFLRLDFDQSMYPEQHVFQITDRIYRLNFINKESGLSAPFILNMNPYRTVSELEREVHEIFGISARVLRKSGRNWLPTSVNDDRTLEMHNCQGKISAKSADVLMEVCY